MATSLGSGIWHILNALPFYTVKRAGWSAKADSEAQEKKCVRSFTSLLVAIHVNYELCGKAINIYSATKLTCYVLCLSSRAGKCRFLGFIYTQVDI